MLRKQRRKKKEVKAQQQKKPKKQRRKRKKMKVLGGASRQEERLSPSLPLIIPGVILPKSGQPYHQPTSWVADTIWIKKSIYV